MEQLITAWMCFFAATALIAIRHFSFGFHLRTARRRATILESPRRSFVVAGIGDCGAAKFHPWRRP